MIVSPKHPLETDNFGSNGSSIYFLFCEIPIPPEYVYMMPPHLFLTARFVGIGAAETVLSGTGLGI